MAFVSNILFWRESGYFDTDAENKPLLHTWSLAVEEQYYLVFRVMLFLLWRFGRRPTLGVIVGLTLLSFGLSDWMSRHASSANFYLLPSRMWELFAGSICAFAVPHLRGNQLLAGLGLGLIAGGIVLIDATMRFPGPVTLVPVLGAVLIVLFARPGTWAAAVLSWRPMVGIGLVSYSLYLWHQPIFAIARLRFGHRLTEWHMAGLIGLALVLAVLTWRFVEQPFRGRKAWLPERRQIFAASGLGMAAFAAFGVMGIATQGAAFRYPEGYATLLAGYNDRADETCKLESHSAFPPGPIPGCISENLPVRDMLFGDSHAWALSTSLKEAAETQGLGLNIFTHDGCVPIPDLYRPTSDQPRRCAAFVEQGLAQARALKIERLILIGRFSSRYHESGFDNGEGGIETEAKSPTEIFDVPATELASKETRLPRLRDAMRDRLVELSKDFKLVIVEPIPEAGWHVPATGMQRMKKTGTIPYLSTSYARYHARNDPVVALLHEVQARAEPGRVTLVRVDDLFCHEDTGRCDNIVDGVPLYFDDDHLSNAGARRIAPRILEALQHPDPER